MKKCKKLGDSFWAYQTRGFKDSGPELQMIGRYPKYTPYLNIEKDGIVLGSVSGRRELKMLRRAINIALGEK